jgi:hypothetical protein
MGLHFAAVDPRVRCVAAFAPLVEFLALKEFGGTQNAAAAESLALIHHALHDTATEEGAVWIASRLKGGTKPPSP